jgi:hypothetical protein
MPKWQNYSTITGIVGLEAVIGNRQNSVLRNGNHFFYAKSAKITKSTTGFVVRLLVNKLLVLVIGICFFTRGLRLFTKHIPPKTKD